jgi:hypothetical protein
VATTTFTIPLCGKVSFHLTEVTIMYSKYIKITMLEKKLEYLQIAKTRIVERILATQRRLNRLTGSDTELNAMRSDRNTTE